MLQKSSPAAPTAAGVASTKRKPFTDRKALERAVLAECKRTYQRLTRHAFSKSDRANFSDRKRPKHEEDARELMGKLRGVLVEVARFGRDYQREPLSQIVVGPDGTELSASETSYVRRPVIGRTSASRARPDDRTMACVSLLLLPIANWPTIHARRLEAGINVEDVLELEGNAIRAQRSRMVAQWKAKNSSRS